MALGFLVACNFAAFSQEKSNAELNGDKFFFRYAYDKAIDAYSSDKQLTVSGNRNLAESYFNMGNNEQADSMYRIILNAPSQAIPEDFYNYAMVLKNQGNYVGSNGWMNTFYTAMPDDLRAKSYDKNNANLESYLLNKPNCKITKLAMNTSAQDFGTAYYNDKIVYASSNAKPKMIKRKYNWTGQPFLNLYCAEVKNGELENIEFFNKKINDKMHEGLASFSNDGSKMAYTKNNKKDYNDDDVVELQIYLSEFKNNKWSEAIPFPYNNEAYSMGHPCLSSDGMTMYFASDMPGGMGGVDLYKSSLVADGNWTVPVNLGNTINTEGDEMFPYFQESTKSLYFSSNGHFGLGGLDVFSSTSIGSSWGAVKNFGSPINSQADDFSLIFNQGANTGFFSTNRLNGLGDDDIYSFEQYSASNLNRVIVGIAKDMKGAGLKETFVSLFNPQDSLLAYVISASDGSFIFNVDKDLNFLLVGSKEKYSNGSARVSSFGEADTIYVTLLLKQDNSNVPVIDNGLTKIAKLNPIHFDFDKWNIRADAADELNKIVRVMNAYPLMEIELSAFADCRGSEEYNIILSENRAQATTQYIQNRISNPNRISGKGYGETNSVNECVCNEDGSSDCTDQEHENNRRTEFVITK